MGKPFAEEVAQLDETHAWACEQSVDALSDAIERLWDRPLVAVGSGGELYFREKNSLAKGCFRLCELPAFR